MNATGPSDQNCSASSNGTPVALTVDSDNVTKGNKINFNYFVDALI